MTAIISWTIVNERTLTAWFRQTAGHLSAIVAFLLTRTMLHVFLSNSAPFCRRISLLKTCRAISRSLGQSWACDLGRRLHAKKRLISQATLVIFGQRRKAMQSADIEEHKRHDAPRRRSLWHNKQKWMEQVESTAKNNLLCGENYAA